MPSRRPRHKHAPAIPAITTARLENGSFWFVQARPSFLPPQQRRQLRNVGRDPARLVFGQNLGLQAARHKREA
jgi:hypothetical protein